MYQQNIFLEHDPIVREKISKIIYKIPTNEHVIACRRVFVGQNQHRFNACAKQRVVARFAGVVYGHRWRQSAHAQPDGIRQHHWQEISLIYSVASLYGATLLISFKILPKRGKSYRYPSMASSSYKIFVRVTAENGVFQTLESWIIIYDLCDSFRYWRRSRDSYTFDSKPNIIDFM